MYILLPCYNDYDIFFLHLLQELEEIYIDTSNTVNIAMESHALMLLTKVRKTTLAQSKRDNSVKLSESREFDALFHRDYQFTRSRWLSSFWSAHFHTNSITLRYLIWLNFICPAAKYRVTWGLKNSSWAVEGITWLNDFISDSQILLSQLTSLLWLNVNTYEKQILWQYIWS